MVFVDVAVIVIIPTSIIMFPMTKHDTLTLRLETAASSLAWQISLGSDQGLTSCHVALPKLPCAENERFAQRVLRQSFPHLL
jgi:hypothetical protein